MSQPPDWMAKPLSWVGLRWPDGDPDRLDVMGEAWLNFSREMQSINTTATEAAEKAWANNSGPAIENFRSWWKGTDGPGTLMASAAGDAEKMGTASGGMSTGVTLLQANFIAGLSGIALATIGGALVGGIGAVVTAPVAATAARIALGVAIGAAVFYVIANIIGQMLEKTDWREKDRTIPAPTPIPLPNETPQIDPEPSPQASIEPIPIPKPDEDINNRCAVPPGYPQTPSYSGDTTILNRDSRGTGVWSVIGQRNDDTSHTIISDGFIRDPLAKRQDMEARMQSYRNQIGVPQGWRYDASHAWPWRFGTELAADVKLSPWEFNRGPQKTLENWIVEQHELLKPENGWAELRTRTKTQPEGAWMFQTQDQYGNTQDRMAGQRFLREITYDVTLCRRGQPPELHVFKAEIDPPTSPRGADFRLSQNWPRAR